MRYLFFVLLVSACGVLTPTNRERPAEVYQPVEMLGNFGEETFGKAEEAMPEEPKRTVHKVTPVIGVLPPCKTDSDLERAIIQKIECLSETANHPALP